MLLLTTSGTILLFKYTDQNQFQYQSVLPAAVSKTQTEENWDVPVRLRIPATNTDAHIQHLGVTTTGEMDVPTNTSDVGWYKFGPRPGERGSAVIAGHLNTESGEPAVFADLHNLKENDVIFVEDKNEKIAIFSVREVRVYDPGRADEVFTKSDGTYLNLITCDGLWDEAKNSYSKRLVVFASIEPLYSQ